MTGRVAPSPTRDPVDVVVVGRLYVIDEEDLTMASYTSSTTSLPLALAVLVPKLDAVTG